MSVWFVDCSQQDFVDDPMGVVRRVYDHFAMTLDDQTEEALASHIAANPKGKHGKHEYSLEEYGLTHELISERCFLHR